MAYKIALAGNPNSGKTTLFNALTGSNQFVGNWPGVTVEKKEGYLRSDREVVVVDLPGIYSLSPYTSEEVVARQFLIGEHPDAILNIVDGTNLERNLYLTTQLIELGIPVVIAVNMMDVVTKNGDVIHIHRLSDELGCEVMEISALKGTGIAEAAQTAVEKAKARMRLEPKHNFCGSVEHAIAHIEEAVADRLPKGQERWYAIKLFERDARVIQELDLPQELLSHIEEDIRSCERELDDDAESIITNERYNYITSIIQDCYTRKNAPGMTVSDKIDYIVTNRWLALPIFAAVMFITYYISVTTIGTWANEWAAEGVFGDGWTFFGHFVPGIPGLVEDALTGWGCAEWLIRLIVDGIIGGVGAVLGFIPQLLVLFFFLAFLEACGYMSRIAFIMDRIFRKFGLSGKSFIPMLIGTGCSVPGIMASRTIESERDRKMTVITTSFIPCSAKLPVISLFASAIFGGAWWVAPSAYFVGVLAVLFSGILLKKLRLFRGEDAAFVMELPAYHMPTLRNILRSMWERSWSFIKKAGTVILLCSMLIWFLSNFGFTQGQFGMVTDMSRSFLATFGSMLAWIFRPLGFGEWPCAVATLTGLVAKENIVSTFGILFGAGELSENGAELWQVLSEIFTGYSAYAFLLFNLLCCPCVAAVGAIRREMHSAKWTLFAVGYQTILAYGVALVVNQFGALFSGHGSWLGPAAACLIVAAFLYLLLRRGKNDPVSEEKEEKREGVSV